MNRPQAFTLIEILIVLMIIMIMIGFVIPFSSSDRREEEVRGAAEELAAVLRETRERALLRNYSHAVVFNITNAPGSSGRILNNRTGGHWYRVIGTSDQTGTWNIDERLWNRFPYFDWTASPVNGNQPGNNQSIPIKSYVELVSRSWIDEPHVLPPRKVRFLALLDQDNGDNMAPDRGGYYTTTYPRPWFGWWESSTGLLHAWGGYDPELKGESQGFLGWGLGSMSRTMVGGRLASPSGFYYEGWDGEIQGCRNPKDREVRHDNGGGNAGIVDASDTASYTLYKEGESRPLINADWLDYMILFHPDGTVCDDWFRMRQGYWKFDNARPNNQDPFVPTYPALSSIHAGVMDRCNGMASRRNWSDPQASYPALSAAQREATTYVQRTGFYWITLAPDALEDNATFPSAQAALRSISPMYRVGISPEGHVKVVRVHNTSKRALDNTITGSDWQDKNKIWGKTGATWSASTPITMSNYINHELRIHGAPPGSPLPMPVSDTVTPEMLSQRSWWWAP